MAECWSCGAERGRASFCTSCGKIQPLSGADPFALLGLPRAMRLDPRALEQAFRERQKESHPDRFAQADSVERRLAVELTSALNEAYRALKDEQTRAEQLLRLEDPGAAAEGARTQDLGLLSEMLELQEQVEESRAPAVLEALLAELMGRRRARLERVARYLDERQGERAQAHSALEELRYLRRLIERIELKLEG